MSLETPTRRTVNMSMSNIDNQVAALLYATGAVSDRENINNIEYGEPQNGIVSISFDVGKERETPEKEKT